MSSPELAHRIVVLHRITLIFVFVWIAGIAANFIRNVLAEHRAIETWAKSEAQVILKRDEALQLFLASRGGVYLPVDEKTRPNPHLPRSGRDVVTTTGEVLTLINGENLFRKVDEEYGPVNGMTRRLIGFKPLNPANRPDEWEQKILLTLEKERRPVLDFGNIGGISHLRYLSPLLVQESCLKCHRAQGHKVGDILGALGVNMPMAPYLREFRKRVTGRIWGHSVCLIAGLVVIGVISSKYGSRIRENAAIEMELVQYRDHLEELVKERTYELSETNLQLTASEEKLRKSEQKYRNIFENSTEGIFQTGPDGRFLSANPALARMYGFGSPGEMTEGRGDPGSRIYVDSADPERLKALYEAHGSVTHFETRLFRRDGTILWASMSGRAVKDDQGNIICYEGVVEDITSRKEAEEQIRASLHEKEVLLKEIHHRVKNNLQVISSLLNLQSQYIQDPKDIESFQASMDRIKSMALIHDKLYRSKSLAGIYLPDYVQDLTYNLLFTYAFRKNIATRVDIAPISLDIDNAMPVGLIVNELVSNSLKHAFPGAMEGSITVEVREEGKEIILVVADDGVGFPADMDFRTTESLGMQLVVTLVEQLDGTIEIARDRGTKFCIVFKAPGRT